MTTPQMPTRQGRVLRALLYCSVAGIGTATLYPVGGRYATKLSLCLICGPNGAADILRNVFLFLPFGMALGGLLRSRRHALVIGVALSLTIELLQFHIPGRFPAVSDLVFNSFGTALGIRLAHSAHRWLYPPPRSARLLAAGSMGIALVVLALGGHLLRPGLPGEEYAGQWTPELVFFEHYRGEVIDVRLGELSIPAERLSNTAELRALLLSGAPLRVRAIAGPPVTKLAPIFRLNTRRRREVVLLGIEGDDAIFRYHTRSALFLLERPELRAREIFREISVGDLLYLAITPAGNGYCVEVNQLRHCGLGFTASDIGSLLLHSRTMPPWQQRVFGLAALAALFAPTGFWTRRPRGLRRPDHAGLIIRAGLIFAGLALVPPVVGLLPSTPAEYLAGLTGFLAGAWCGARFQGALVTSRRPGTRSRASLGPTT